MLTFKEKIELLENLKNAKLESSLLEKYSDYLTNKALAGPILRKLVSSLIDLDISITAEYECLTDQEWETITSNYDTPLELEPYSTLRDNVKMFLSAYKIIEAKVEHIDVNVLLDVLKLVVFSKTSNIQFLFFKLAICKPDPVLYFLLENLKVSPHLYVPYFASLVARCNIDSSKAVSYYIDYIRSIEKSEDFRYILFCQGLMYICCFRKEHIDMCKDIVNNIFEKHLYRYMNETVVEVFCKTFGFNTKHMNSLDNCALYYFPFDLSLFDAINDMYEDYYVFYEE